MAANDPLIILLDSPEPPSWHQVTLPTREPDSPESDSPGWCPHWGRNRHLAASQPPIAIEDESDTEFLMAALEEINRASEVRANAAETAGGNVHTPSFDEAKCADTLLDSDTEAGDTEVDDTIAVSCAENVAANTAVAIEYADTLREIDTEADATEVVEKIVVSRAENVAADLFVHDRDAKTEVAIEYADTLACSDWETRAANTKGATGAWLVDKSVAGDAVRPAIGDLPNHVAGSNLWFSLTRHVTELTLCKECPNIIFHLQDPCESWQGHIDEVLHNNLGKCGRGFFKVGITFKPHRRVEMKDYKRPDRLMVVSLVSESSDAIAAAEICAIERYGKDKRLMNRSPGGESAHHGFSPFYLYCIFGCRHGWHKSDYVPKAKRFRAPSDDTQSRSRSPHPDLRRAGC